METLRWIVFVILWSFVRGDLQPLKLPMDYESKLQTVLPELLKQADIPTLIKDSLIGSSMASLSSGLNYLKFWDETKNDACKSKLVSGEPKVTKYGRMTCKRLCKQENEARVKFLANALETIAESSEDTVADIGFESDEKIYECIRKDDGYNCICARNDVLRVTPTVQALVYEIFGGNGRIKDVIPDHSLKKILFLVLLYSAEKSYELGKTAIKLPFKMIYRIIKTIF